MEPADTAATPAARPGGGLFSGLVISTSGLSPEETEELEGLLAKNGAELSRSVNESVTYLLSCKSNTRHYQLAQLHGKPTLYPTWVRESIKRGELQDPSGYLVRQFDNISFFLVHRESDSVADIKSLIESNGGTVVNNCDPQSVRYIICVKEFSGQCHLFKDYGIPILSDQWVYECLKRKFLAKYTDFVVKSEGDAFESKESFSFLRECVFTLLSNNPEDYYEADLYCRYAGAILLPRLSRLVTHCVVCTAFSDFPQVKNKYVYVNFVRMSWLIRCCQKKETLPLQPHDFYRANPDVPMADSAQITPQVFQNLRFLVDPEGSDVAHTIVRYGGVLTNKKPEANYIVLTSHSSKYLLEKCVTRFFIEKCIKQSQLVSPAMSLLYTPYPPLFSNIKFSISNYSGDYRVFIKRLVELIDGRCDEFLSQSHTYLISMQASGQKFTKAMEWGIKVVNADWLVDCAKARYIVPLHSKYLVS